MKEAILGELTKGPLRRAALVRRIGRRHVLARWQAKSIDTMVDALRREGLLDAADEQASNADRFDLAETRPGDPREDPTPLGLTRAGNGHLHRWRHGDPTPASFRDDLLLKIAASEEDELPDLDEMVRGRLTAAAELAAEIDQEPMPAISPGDEDDWHRRRPHIARSLDFGVLDGFARGLRERSPRTSPRSDDTSAKGVTDEATLLSLENVSKAYTREGHERVIVLRDVTLRVDRGEFAVVVGDPLSGKTTLLRIAAGLEPPDQGRVRLDDEELRVTGDVDRRVAVVARVAPPREMVSMRMADLLAVPLLDSAPRREARARATGAMSALGVEDLADASWEHLSDVERTLIRIAQATVRRPAVLLVDDPLPGLGLVHVDVVLRSLRRAARDDGAAVVVTVGDLAEAAHADAVHILSTGSLTRAARPDDRGQVLGFPAERRG